MEHSTNFQKFRGPSHQGSASRPLEEAGHPRSRRLVRKSTAVIPEAVAPEEANLRTVRETSSAPLKLSKNISDWSDLCIVGTASSRSFKWSRSRPPGPSISIFRALFVPSPIPGTASRPQTLKSRPKSEKSFLRGSPGKLTLSFRICTWC